MMCHHHYLIISFSLDVNSLVKINQQKHKRRKKRSWRQPKTQMWVWKPVKQRNY